MVELRRILVVAVAAMAHLAVAQQMEAVMELGPGLSPRYFFGQVLAVRQEVCSSGYHACGDVGFPASCCSNDKYCYVKSDGTPACCAMGSNCDNLCTGTDSINRYLCTTTATVSNGIASGLGCCARLCSIDHYLCPNSLGGGGSCCSLGLVCGTSSCLSTVVAPTTLVPIVPSGCTKGQTSCAASIGGGCCNSTATCTDSNSILACFVGTSGPSAIRTGPDGTVATLITGSDAGLSTGAKAGIGVGMAVVGCLVIAGLLWFCMRRRNASRGARTASQQTESIAGAQPMSQSSGNAARRHDTADYFGQGVGPYTDGESLGSVPHRGVPLSPDGPGDIVPAVEIGHSREHSNVTSPGPIVEQKPIPETAEDRVELP